jgi:dephospho-CoA kinase
MLKIGITGGIGSGKSTVTQIFEILNVPIYKSDLEARDLMMGDAEIISEIKHHFGNNAYLDSGILNKKYISDIVFNNVEKLNLLNSIVHPVVFEHFKNWCSLQKSPYILKEAALLFETNFYKENHYNILVSCPLEIRIQNVMKRDGSNREKVVSIINKQMAEGEKEKLADFIIYNNEKSFLIEQVLALHHNFLNII